MSTQNLKISVTASLSAVIEEVRLRWMFKIKLNEELFCFHARPLDFILEEQQKQFKLKQDD